MKKLAFRQAAKTAKVNPSLFSSVKADMMDAVYLDVCTADKWYRVELHHILPDFLPLVLKAVETVEAGEDIRKAEDTAANIIGNVVGRDDAAVRIIPTDMIDYKR